MARPMTSSGRSKPAAFAGDAPAILVALWAAILLLVGVLVYYPGIYYPGDHSPYWGDDYQWVFAHPSGVVFYYFSHTAQLSGFYRPIPAAILAIVQSAVGAHTWPVAVINLVLHCCLAFMVFRFCLYQRLSLMQSCIASLFMMVSQANAQAVAENDTTSQLGATAFAYLALYLLHLAGAAGWQESSRGAGGWRQYWLSLVAFTVSLLFKETSLAFLGLVLGVLVVDSWACLGRTLAQLLYVLRRWLPYIVVTGIYLVARARAVGSAHPAFGTQGRYSLHVGANVIKNLAEFVVAEWIPMSSVQVFVALAQRQIIVLAVVAFVTALLVLAVAGGIVLAPSRQRWLGGLMLLFSLVAASPALVLNQTSELYVYNAMPFIAVVAGIGIGRLAVSSPGRLVWVVVLAVAALLLSEAMAVRSKEVLLRDNGELATRLLPQITSEIDRHPLDTRVYLMNPMRHGTEYSEYRVAGFHVFSTGENIFDELSSRANVTVAEIEPTPRDRLAAYGPRSLVLTYDPKTLRVRRVAP